MRETSIETYYKIKSTGLLSKMRLNVLYAIVQTQRPCTSAEALNNMPKTSNSPLNQSRARFTELRDRGVLYEAGKRKCRITGNSAIMWDLTGNMPTKYIKPPNLKDKIAELRRMVVDINTSNLDMFQLNGLQSVIKYIDNNFTK